MKYRNRKSGVVVSVRDGKVLSSHDWESLAASKPPARKAPPRKRAQPTESE